MKSNRLKKKAKHNVTKKPFKHIFWYKMRIKYRRVKQQLFSKRPIKLIWDRLQNTLNNTLYTKKKTKHKKYIYPLFNRTIKRFLYKYKIHSLRDIQKYTSFYSLVWRKKKKQNLKFVVFKKVHIIGMIGKIKTAIKHFIMQRRRIKDGFTFWQSYTVRWLHLSILKNRTIRFYFTPLRTKKWIITKKLKYLKIYARFYNLHPRIGQWSTVGIVGNYWGRNTLYMKRKILINIFSNFYGIHAYKLFKHVKRKFNKIYSRFIDKNTIMLDFFERRTDIVVFRAGLTVSIDLARMLVCRGYINVNNDIIRNPHSRVYTGDLMSVPHFLRHMHLFTLLEHYESFRYLYIGRMYKNTNMNIMSSYLTTLVKTLTQMSNINFWTRSLSTIRHLLEQSDNYSNYLPLKESKDLQVNLIFNSTYNFDKESSFNKIKPLNWLYFQQENYFFNQRQANILRVINHKKNTIKQKYNKTMWNILLLRKKLNQQEYKTKQKTLYVNFNIFKLLLKDIVGQTWENFPNNMLINIAYRYGLIFQVFSMETSFTPKSISDHGRINFNHFRWLLINV